MAATGFDLPVMHFEDAAAWERWLASHAEEKGVWLRMAKKGQGAVSVNYSDAVDVALCHGWIDGQKRTFDTQFFALRFTPRRPRSIWSKLNRERVERLIAAGRMQPRGLREVDAAKADGRWDNAYDSSSTMPVPPELAAALSRNRKAAAFFETLDRANRYAVCWRVQTAKKAETRAARVERLVDMLARGEKIHG